MVKVLVVDDHQAFRQPLALLLNREPEFNVVAQAGSLAEAHRKLQKVDLALVDLELPDGSGADLIGALRAISPQSSVLFFSGPSENPVYHRIVGAGVGVVDKSAPLEAILQMARRLGREAI
jgi:DNA-binding NarL/FixJ family response regulator